MGNSAPPHTASRISSRWCSTPLAMSPILSILSRSLVKTQASTSASCCGSRTRSPLDSSYSMPQWQNSSLATCADCSSMASVSATAKKRSQVRLNSCARNCLSRASRALNLRGTLVVVCGSCRAARTRAPFNSSMPRPSLESTARMSRTAGCLRRSSRASSSFNATFSLALVVARMTGAPAALSRMACRISSMRRRVSVRGLCTRRNTAWGSFKNSECV